MYKLILLCKWTVRAWPVLIFFVLVPIHIATVSYLPLAPKEVNKVISLAMQLVGGLLVLYSIDSNMGVIKGRRLREIFIAYIKEIPQMGKPVTISAQGLSVSTSLGGANITVAKNPITLDEKLAYLQKQITDLKSDLTTQSANLHQKITDVQNDLDGKIRETSLTIRDLQKKVDEVTVGGIKLQLFGVLLLIHGAIAGYFT